MGDWRFFIQPMASKSVKYLLDPIVRTLFHVDHMYVAFKAADVIQQTGILLHFGNGATSGVAR